MTFVYLDTETTGLDPDRHEVWELAYAVDDGPIKSGVMFHSLRHADPMALAMNGYWERVKDASPESWADLENGLRSVLDGATLVAANPAFDAAFLRARWGAAPWRYRMLDIEAYAMPAIGLDEPIGMQKIAEKLGVTPGEAHTAAGDVHTLRWCHQVLRAYYRDSL